MDKIGKVRMLGNLMIITGILVVFFGIAYTAYTGNLLAYASVIIFGSILWISGGVINMIAYLIGKKIKQN